MFDWVSSLQEIAPMRPNECLGLFLHPCAENIYESFVRPLVVKTFVSETILSHSMALAWRKMRSLVAAKTTAAGRITLETKQQLHAQPVSKNIKKYIVQVQNQ